MSSSSRQSSVSPIKSRGNTPLQLKSDNVKRSRSTSPLKSHLLRHDNSSSNILSSTKLTITSNYLSPTRSPLKSSGQLQRPKFTIYQDDTDYRSVVKLPKTPSRQDELRNVLITPDQEDKENNICVKQIPIKQQSELSKRIPLCDLDIKSYPGFIQEANATDVLLPRYQLQEMFKPEQITYKNLPSFVTPPRKRLVNVRYDFKTRARKDLGSTLRKSMSFDDRISKPFITKPTKSLKFQIFNDTTA